MYSVSLGKPNSQLVALCVFLWIRAQTPIPLEKPNSQLVALCVFLWIRAQTPIPLEKPNSQLVALCVFLWIRAQTPIPLEKPKPKARGPEAFCLSVCPVWSLGRLVFSSVFSGFKACHVTAAKMLPPLVWHVFGSNLTSPLPPDPGLVGLRLRCGGAFASRRSGHREASCFFQLRRESDDVLRFQVTLRHAVFFFSQRLPLIGENRDNHAK